MRIAGFELLEADGGFGKLWFLKISDADGLSGWSEFSEGLGSSGLSAIVATLAKSLVGRDPRDVGRLGADLRANARLQNGGLTWQAIGAIENACLDLKARALGVAVHELLGGAVRDHLAVYWSHCGMRRLDATVAEQTLQVPRVRTLEDLTSLGEEVRERGFQACKTNPIAFDPESGGTLFNPGFRSHGLEHGRTHGRDDLAGITAQLDALRAGVGASVEIALDVNFGFTLDGIKRLLRAVETQGLMWLEVDVPEPAGLAAVRASARTPIASLEYICGAHNFRAYFEARAVDIAIVDVMWNGVLEAARIAALAGSFDVNVATHGYSGVLATAMAVQFAAATPNLETVELEVDNAPWAEDFLVERLVVEDGRLLVPNGPGWGIDVDEDAIRAHASTV